MIFTRDFITRENDWQIASLFIPPKSLFTVTHALFFMYGAVLLLILILVSFRLLTIWMNTAERAFSMYNDMDCKYTHTCNGEKGQITHNEDEIHVLYGSSKMDLHHLQLSMVG